MSSRARSVVLDPIKMQRFADLATVTRSVFIVIDYAETRQDELITLLQIANYLKTNHQLLLKRNMIMKKVLMVSSR